ncbi:MAG TPA: hypothetical protein PLD59_12305 [Tepidisphaeraceae bacterium]|nr:hypothetical protein [Tepidisphaeraceae bacterium]
MNFYPRNSLAITAVAFAVCAASLLAIGGCDNSTTIDGVARVSPESVKGKTAVRGTVKFLGTAPERKVLKNEPCHDGAPKTILDETVVVSADRGLMNVFVYIDNGPQVDGGPLPDAVLDQVDCRYVPHVVGVVVGQGLKVKSSDPAFHNTHYTPGRNASNNFGLLRAGHEKTVRFTAPEIFHVRCDVHPWMSAYIGVFDNPFFAATREDGSFELNNVPAGQYMLVAWHEIYGELRRSIAVGDDGTIDVDFEYKPPS